MHVFGEYQTVDPMGTFAILLGLIRTEPERNIPMRIVYCLAAVSLLTVSVSAQTGTPPRATPMISADDVTDSPCFQRLKQVVPGLEESLSGNEERELRQLIRPAIILARRGNEPACEVLVEEIERLGEQGQTQATRGTTSPPVAQTQVSQMQIIQVENLIDREVLGATGEDIGDIQDVLVVTGAPARAYAVIDRDGWFTNRAPAVIPLNALDTTAEGDVFLGASEDVVDRAPVADLENLTAANVEEVDVYWVSYAR